MAKILLKSKNSILAKSFVSISQAAKFLQVSPDTLRNWEKAGKLLPSRTSGGARRYNRSELLNLKKEVSLSSPRKKGLISISLAARALKVSPDTLRNWGKKGLIDSYRTQGGARRFTRSEIENLQKELGIQINLEDFQKKAAPKWVKTSNFTPSFYKITFSGAMIMLMLLTGWLLSSYITPLESKVNKTAKLVEGIVGSIESLQKGVLGIQSQPQLSPIVLPGNLNIQTAKPQTTVVFGSAKAPINLDSSSGVISCPDCLTLSSTYILSLASSDGSLNAGTDEKKVTISLNLGHTNTWESLQNFNRGIFVEGNVGIGITSPVNKLDVAGAQTIGAGFAGAYQAPSNGLLVEGSVGIGISAPSYKLDVVGGARFGCETTNNWNNGPATDCSDIAEVYQSDGSVEPGEIVTIGEQNTVTKSLVPYQKNILGVFSTSPALLIGGQTIIGGQGDLSGSKIPVALAGRVAVKVSDENGPIQVGDFLTSSSIPGVAMKATKAGTALGQALEPFDVSFADRDELVGQNSNHLVEIKRKFGIVLAFINVTFADPSDFLSGLSLDEEGNLIIPKIKAASIILDPAVNVAATQLEADDEQLALKVETDLSGKIVSFEMKIKELESSVEHLAQKLSESGNVGIGSDNEATSSSSVALSETKGINYTLHSVQNDSTASAQITTDSSSLTTNYQLPTTDLDLTPPDVLLATGSATLVDLSVKETLSSDKLFEGFDIQASGDLEVFGKTTLAETFIAGDLAVDGTMSISGNSINSLACHSGESSSPESDSGIADAPRSDGCGVLYLQNGPLVEKIDFFNGLVTIDKSGNLKAQSVTVAEFKVVANKISGSGKILQGTKSVDIPNSQVQKNSRILITPTSATNLVLAVTGKDDGNKFTVSTAADASEDIIFDWFIVGENP